MLDIVTVFIDCLNAFPFNEYVKIVKSFTDSLHIDSIFSLALPFDATFGISDWKNTLFYQDFIGSGRTEFGELVLIDLCIYKGMFYSLSCAYLKKP